MVYDTLRQKFIYNTPFDENEFPKVELDDVPVLNAYFINASSLYLLEENDFNKIVSNIEGNYAGIIILNDYKFSSFNKILEDGAKCHMLAFAYLFKQKGFLCNIV